MFSFLTRQTTFQQTGVLILLTLLSGCGTAETLQVEDGKIRALLPNRDTTAGYFTLTNHTASPVTIVGAKSDLARAIEMHKTVIKNDRVRMQRVQKYEVAPGEQAKFAPGGLHLMIFGVIDIPSSFPFTLVFEDGRQLKTQLEKFSD